MSEEHKTPRCPTLLVILDGFGMNPSKLNNAVQEASTPRLDEYMSTHPHTLLEACGRAVGLPDGQMGNSEVGHLTLGCGTVVRQDLVRIDDAISDGSFFENSALTGAVLSARDAGRPVHLLGLVSDGGVHSHVRHLHALIRLCQRLEAKPLVHMITDGRDTPPRSASAYLAELEALLAEGGGCIATVAGRYYAMDRDRRWDRTQKAFDAVVHGKGERVDSAEQAIRAAYEAGETDEFIKPRIVNPDGMLRPGDSLIFFNFRNDRPRQLAAALGMDDFDAFDRGDFRTVSVTCLTEYDPRFLSPIGFPPERPSVTLAEVISTAGIRQFHCAETEKYAHVTFFFNGGKEEPFAGEDRVMVPSPQVATYDLQPEMSAKEVADETIKAIESGHYGFVVVNFANGDMVGHTAVRDAVIAAVEAMDTQVGRVLDAAVANGFSVVLTADHGNCDEMVDPVTGEPHTQHTMYPVPLMIIDKARWRLTSCGGLSGVAPTVLQLMGIPQPKAMRGRSLLLEEVPVAA
jgi:2,3-bisphosphoglycerate-independent phosphoglycerate mutase